MSFGIRSRSFSFGDPIPPRFTCDGENVSPALEWFEAPPGTQSFALIVDDPDAPMGSWVHWLIWDLTGAGIEEAVPPVAQPLSGGTQGKNSWSRIGYGGPCPPSGTHRYYFRLHALDTLLRLAPGSDRSALERAISAHTLAQAVLLGTYARAAELRA